MRRASTPRADSLLMGIFRCCSVSFLLGFHFGFFKCEDNFTDVVGMWWFLTSSGSVTAGPAEDALRCSGTEVQWEMGASLPGDTERSYCGLHCGRWRLFEERKPVEGEAELDVTRVHHDGVTVI